MKVCYESWLFTHPSIPACLAVRLHWSVPGYRAECLWFCHVTSCVPCSLIAESKKGLIMYKIVVFFPSQFLCKIFRSWKKASQRSFSLIQACRTSHFFLYQLIVYWHSIDWFHTHQVSWAFTGWGADLLPSPVDPAVSRFINVKNCKLNPESPNLWFVSCFSNVNIKGPNSANQGLSNGENKLWATCNSNSVDGPILL